MNPIGRVLQGFLLGQVRNEIDSKDRIMNVTAVDQPMHPSGEYAEHFVVTFFSGQKIRVTVADES